MKKTLFALASVLALATGAQAATYSFDVTANPFRVPGAPGLQTRAYVLQASGPQNFNGAMYTTADLNVGESQDIDVYGLVHFDAPLGADDLDAKPSTATFDFGAFGTRTILGTTVGRLDTNDAYADFGDAISFAVGGGLRIIVTLADTVFGVDSQDNFVNGRAGFGLVTATITVAAVPVPATLPLGLSALGLMALVARRRKSANV